jgi:two-component system nitrate/nitrite response regulator NarL
MIRLVLADDHPVILMGLRLLFESEQDFQVVASVTHGEAALESVRRLNPDILVLDLRMPGKDGLEVLREMRREAATTKTVILTALESDDVLDAISLGAAGVVLKDMAATLLVQCVREVHAGGKWLERSIAGRAVGRFVNREARTRRIADILTPREIQVARMVADGLPSKAVASRLAINEGTAKLHLHHVYEKLKLDGRMALVRYMRSKGLD